MARKPKPEEAALRCATCHWFHKQHPADEVGDCTLNPPQVITDGEQILSVRPSLEDNDPACSHHKQRLAS